MVGSEQSLVLVSRRVDRASEEKMRMDGFGKGREWSWRRGENQAEGLEGHRREDGKGLNRGCKEGSFGDRE